MHPSKTFDNFFIYILARSSHNSPGSRPCNSASMETSSALRETSDGRFSQQPESIYQQELFTEQVIRDLGINV
jgi:hypothetical protein